MWHQLDEVLAFEPASVLEIGPGPGVFKAVASQFGPRVETLDLDPDLNPDHVAPADAMTFADKSFDVVCAFQMLEHVPYKKSLAIFAEMARVALKGVVISLPDAATRWPYSLYIPKFGALNILVPRPRVRVPQHEFDDQHYWEINKAGYPVSRVQKDLEQAGGLQVRKTYRVHEHSYHRFFVFTRP